MLSLFSTSKTDYSSRDLSLAFLDDILPIVGHEHVRTSAPLELRMDIIKDEPQTVLGYTWPVTMRVTDKATGVVQYECAGHVPIGVAHLIVSDAVRQTPLVAMFLESNSFIDRAAQILRVHEVPMWVQQQIPSSFMRAMSGMSPGSIENNPGDAVAEDPNALPGYHQRQDATKSQKLISVKLKYGMQRLTVEATTVAGAVLVGKGTQRELYFFLGHPRDGGEHIARVTSAKRFDLTKAIDIVVAPGVDAAAIVALVGAVQRMMSCSVPK
ncbi:hypothetical protein H9P43_001816 [Blastocladiella emersonii ATCC 22665]|nr:hypothetical protein H9P43_001816 [Blastocladiella emersonii ATCC 22665]